MTSTSDREDIGLLDNPLGLDGIEFIEYSTSRPQAFGQALERLGFRPVARHRSREVLLYRQGGMNLVINAHAGARPAAAPGEAPQIAAIALRVRDAGAAHGRALALGAWGVPARVEAMELNIPAIHGVGASRIYFVDRYRDFSIYDVDFTPIPTVDPHPPALTGLHWFGVVQYIGIDRLEDWTEYYRELFGFVVLPDSERFGVLPKGRVLRSPNDDDTRFYLQLIEPEFDATEIDPEERLHRVAFGAPDVLASVRELRQRGVEFVETAGVHSESRGALTRAQVDEPSFELVRHDRPSSDGYIGRSPEGMAGRLGSGPALVPPAPAAEDVE